MPGLVGMVSLNGDKINLGLMQAMRKAIQHRDWYQVDDYVSTKGTVVVSRVHLGIINKEKQPYSARNGQVQVFLHGEICNDETANANPLDFIYHLYEKRGMDFASCLNGSFVIVIVDQDQDTVLIANDRIATKPLFYFTDGRYIYFGPEMKSLFLVTSLERKLNLAAVADFITNGYFTTEHTLIEGLQRMDSATVLRVKTGGVAWHKYWEFDIEKGDKDRGFRFYQATLAGLVRQAVRRRLRTDSTYGILLSGGYDSRGILGCYLEERGKQGLHTISWGREEDIPNSDCIIAKQLAQKLGADHRFYKLTAEEVFDNFHNFIWLGEGLTDYAESFNVFHRIRKQQGVDIVLRGDEDWGCGSLFLHDEHMMLRGLNINTLPNIEPYRRILRPDYHRLFCELDAETTRQISSRCKAKNIHNRKDFFALDTYLRYTLNPLNYVKAFALESLTPWLDYDILDFMSTLPLKYRLDKILYRKTVLAMFPELFAQVAQNRNDIDWAASFKSSPALQRFVYQQLIEEPNILGEFIDKDGLKSELGAFFLRLSNPQESSGLMAAAKTNMLGLLGRTPAVFNLTHKSAYYVRKWIGKLKDPLPPEKLIMRLLILNVWGDVFLNYPVVNIEKSSQKSND